MNPDAWLTVAVLGCTLVLLASDRYSPALVVFGATVLLMILGVTEPAEAFSGFSNPAPFTVAALYVVARAVEKTGGLQPLVVTMLGRPKGRRRSLVRLLVPASAASAFLNNTPVVAMVSPQVSSWAEANDRPASWFLMPLSFAAILGGLVTVIGTSTTIVVSGLLESHGQAPIGMFEITRIGLPIAVVGVALLVVIAPLLLPDRRAARKGFEEEAREFTVRMVVEPGGPVDHATVEDAGLRHLQGVFLAEVEREGEVIAPATPETRLQGGDRLIFVGRADQVVDLQRKSGLRSAERKHALDFHDAGHTYFEAVIGTGSPLNGRTLQEAEFRSRYGAAVLAIHRSGERIQAKLGQVTLHAGDTLLVLAPREFEDRWQHRTHFLLISHLGGMAPTSSRQAWLVGGVLVGVVSTAALGLLPILHAALAGAFLLLVLGVLSAEEVRRAVDLEVVVLIAAAFGLGAAMEESGLAGLIGSGVLEAFSSLGTRGVLLGVVLTTLVLTELITNNAAAVLMFPIALSAAGALGVDPRPFAIAVAVTASASFLTPIGYQTNTMVYGPGGYRFTDYARLGLPLTATVVVLVTLLVPTLWAL